MKAVKHFLNGDILDIGCGSASLMHLLDETQHYVGIDLDDNLIQCLRERFPTCEFYQKDIETDDLLKLMTSRKFDTITLIAIIEHLRHPENILKQCYTLLRDNKGILVITTPSPLGDSIHIIAVRVSLTSKVAVMEHYKIYSRDDFEQLLSSLGFMIFKYQKFMCVLNQLFLCKRIQDGENTCNFTV